MLMMMVGSLVLCSAGSGRTSQKWSRNFFEGHPGARSRTTTAALRGFFETQIQDFIAKGRATGGPIGLHNRSTRNAGDTNVNSHTGSHHGKSLLPRGGLGSPGKRRQPTSAVSYRAASH